MFLRGNWSHDAGAQQQSHAWYGEPSLTNLVVELVYNLPNDRSLKSITIQNGLAVVEKGAGGPSDFHLDSGYAYFRDRSPIKL